MPIVALSLMIYTSKMWKYSHNNVTKETWQMLEKLHTPKHKGSTIAWWCLENVQGLVNHTSCLTVNQEAGIPYALPGMQSWRRNFCEINACFGINHEMDLCSCNLCRFVYMNEKIIIKISFTNTNCLYYLCSANGSEKYFSITKLSLYFLFHSINLQFITKVQNHFVHTYSMFCRTQTELQLPFRNKKWPIFSINRY